MLVLSRKRGEVITVGEHIRIIMIDIRGDKCRIGIECDPSIPVHRLEVYEAIKRSQEQQ